MPGNRLRLLSLDGGGIRGVSSLMILRRLMATVTPGSSPKPCDYFDMIGGTSTGGLIAIMLGRLGMTVDECIEAYVSLSDRVFEKKSHRVKINGKLQGRYDKTELERAIKEILIKRGLPEDALLKDVDAACKVFVCATSKETGDTTCLTNYHSLRQDNSDLLDVTTIWEAGRATSAATTFFEPIAIGPFHEKFVDGALGANNPIFEMWNQAQDVWGDELDKKLECLVSIGTGLPGLQPVRDDIVHIGATLKALATETEKTAEQFHRDKPSLDDQGRYYRFNVARGLEEIGLAESKKQNEIAAVTRRYVESQAVFRQMRRCADNLSRREYFGPYRTAFSLQGVPTSNNFVERPSDTAQLERCLLPSRKSGRIRRQLFILHGLGGMGKTQLAVDFTRRSKDAFSSVFWLDGRSEDNLKQSFAKCAKRIPKGQIPDKSRTFDSSKNEGGLATVVVDVLNWLAQPDNVDWLLVFDNVDLDYEDGVLGAYDVRQYLPGDHGSVLITTRLSRLAQLGDSKRLEKVDQELSQAIFGRWCGSDRDAESLQELLKLLDGLPLALAQAASYLHETGLNPTCYIRLYKQQFDELIGNDSKNGPPLSDYPASIGTTWMLSFKAIESKSESAANLLRFWAFLDNKDMWHGLLQAASGPARWPEWLCEMACNEVSYLEAARLLLRYSMIEAQESVSGGYSMHQVVHRWMSHIQNTDARKEYTQLAVMLIGFSVRGPADHDSWIIQRRRLAHAERCSWWLKEVVGDTYNVDDVTTISRAMNNLGNLYIDQGRLPEAEAMYERALRGDKTAYGSEHIFTLDTVYNLGILYCYQGRPLEAEAMYKRALRGFEKAYGSEHIVTLKTVHNLGILYHNQGRLLEAKAMCEQALQGYEKALGPEAISTHRHALRTLNNLGIIYEDLEEMDKARSCYERAQNGYGLVLGYDSKRYKELSEAIRRLSRSRREEESSRCIEENIKCKEKGKRGTWGKIKDIVRGHA
ncbi:FabD/lysophospholipase-like protein [Ustulina deusta]|nr:FabD/lysophospholipase-like protein [Ustulina deusta]